MARTRAAHSFGKFLCRRFAWLQPETSRNFLVTRFMDEILYVFLFTVCLFVFFFSLRLIFTLVAASTFHFLSATITFSYFCQRIRCFFIAGSSSFAVYHVNVDNKFSRKKNSPLLLSLLFFSLSKDWFPTECRVILTCIRA